MMWMKSSKGHLHILCEKYIFVQDQRNANIKIMSNSAAITGRRSRGFTEEWFLCSYGTISYQCSRSWWQRCEASISHHIWSFGFQTHVCVLKTSNWSTDPLLIIHYCTALQRWQHSLLHQKIFITNCTKSNPTGPAESKLFRTNWIQTVQHERAGCENFLCFSPPPKRVYFLNSPLRGHGVSLWYPINSTLYGHSLHSPPMIYMTCKQCCFFMKTNIRYNIKQSSHSAKC